MQRSAGAIGKSSERLVTDHRCPEFHAGQVAHLAFARIVGPLQLAAASGAHQFPIAALPPDPKLQALRPLIDFMSVDSVTCPVGRFGKTALKESLDRLWTYRYEGAMLRYLQGWIDQLRWQRLRPFQKLAQMLLDHLEGILNYCRTKVPLGVVEAVNGNIKALLRRGRGYRNLRYLLLKGQRMAAIRTEFVIFKKNGLKMQLPSDSCSEPEDRLA